MGEDNYTNAQDEVSEETTPPIPSQTKMPNPLEARAPVDVTKPIPIEPDGGMGVGASDVDSRDDGDDKPAFPTLKELDRLRELSYYGQMLTEDDIDFFSKMLVRRPVTVPFVDAVFANELDTVKDMVINHDMDFIFCTDGSEGSGKSTAAMSFCKYLDPTFNIDRVCFTLDEFLEQVKTVPRYSAVLLDEAYASAGARASLTEINKALIAVTAEMRQRNLFCCLCIPSFFDLDRYFALWRCRALVHVYINRHKRRGNYVIFPTHEKKLLYLFGKKLYKYTFPKSPMDVCHFKNEYVVDELEYRAKKAMAFRMRCLDSGRSMRSLADAKIYQNRFLRAIHFMQTYDNIPVDSIAAILGIPKAKVNHTFKKEVTAEVVSNVKKDYLAHLKKSALDPSVDNYVARNHTELFVQLGKDLNVNVTQVKSALNKEGLLEREQPSTDAATETNGVKKDGEV